MNLPDGIHPNAQGYRVIAQNLYPYVKQAIVKINGR
jgi:lysophospholipase L1-like esterase